MNYVFQHRWLAGLRVLFSPDIGLQIIYPRIVQQILVRLTPYRTTRSRAASYAIPRIPLRGAIRGDFFFFHTFVLTLYVQVVVAEGESDADGGPAEDDDLVRDGIIDPCQPASWGR